MDSADLVKLVPLVAACVLAWGIYHTNRRWEDQKRFERAREEERATAERRSLAASLLAEQVALHELVTKNELVQSARAQLNREDCAFHIPIRDREVMTIYVAQVSRLGTLGEDVNTLLARHYSILHAFLDENGSIADAATADQIGMPYDREVMRNRVRDQISVLELLAANYEALVLALREKSGADEGKIA